MNEAILVFPNQLYENSDILFSNKEVFLIEEERYFCDFKFHKNKLVLHRASMKFYKDFLTERGFKVSYIDFSTDYLKLLEDRDITSVDIIDVVDFKLRNKLETSRLKINWLKSPSFLTNKKDFAQFFKGKNHYSQTSFYINQRKNLSILTNEERKPIGGKWSFDKENRRKLPKDFKPPKMITFGNDDYVSEAKTYIKRHFANNYGVTSNFIYPVTHCDVKVWFDDFLLNRFALFGDYEDAIDKDSSILFHSCISYALNIGLVTPDYLIRRALRFASDNNIPLNSLEGFIRQIISWREFMKGVYELDNFRMRNSNFFNHKNKMPSSFYTATTGIEPIDDTIRKILETGYANHIERLMVLGNFMFLCEISPTEIYKWFMEMFIDSYDWVMVPNVFSMSQFADGGKITTKPYFSSSNYIKKMSNYKDNAWQETWNDLYWRFVEKHYDYFYENPRTRVMVSAIDGFAIRDHKIKADRFLTKFLDET